MERGSERGRERKGESDCIERQRVRQKLKGTVTGLKREKEAGSGGPTISEAPNFLVLHSLWETGLDRKPWPGRRNS